MSGRPPVSVVVPCRDRAANLAGCLAALGQVLGGDDEVIVVDSASRDGSVVAAARAAGASAVRCDRPGASRARNEGWRAARHDLVLFTDDDMQVTAGWADALAAAFTDPAVGFAVGRTTLPPDVRLTREPATVTRVAPPELIVKGTPGALGASNNVGLPKAVLAAVGGFDERMGPGTWIAAGEDLELFDRVLGSGRTGRFVPEALAYHDQWRTPRERRRLQWAYGKGMGARIGALARRDPGTAWRLRGEVLRLRGLRTAARRVAPSVPAAAGAVEDVSGWTGPVAWRLGALTGLAVGLLRLRPRR